MPYPQLNYGIDAPGAYDAGMLGNVWQPPIMMADAGMPAVQNVPARQHLGGMAFIPGYAAARAQQVPQVPQVPQMQQVQQPNLGDLLRMMGIAVQQGETIPLTQPIAALSGQPQGSGNQDFLSGILKGLMGGGGAMGGGMAM